MQIFEQKFLVIAATTTAKLSLLSCSSIHQTQGVESRQFLSSGLVTAVQRADRKLTFIPIMFILLRIWGTIQFFYSILVSIFYRNGQCVPEWAFNGYLVLGYMQVSTALQNTRDYWRLLEITGDCYAA